MHEVLYMCACMFFSSQIEFKAGDKYRNILYEMKKSLFHRGPDDSGIYLGRHCGFAHTRLAIRGC